jgi:hypothetical protein
MNEREIGMNGEREQKEGSIHATTTNTTTKKKLNIYFGILKWFLFEVFVLIFISFRISKKCTEKIV